MQTSEEMAPRLPLNLPVLQSLHEVDPFEGTNFPIGQRAHIDSFQPPSEALNLPAVQLVHDVAAVGDVAYFPGAQLTQSEILAAP